MTMPGQTIQAGPAARAERAGARRSLPLLVLGAGADPASERGVDCPGELPPASDPGLVARALSLIHISEPTRP